ncbi:SET domain-containing protein [Cytobacillus purgationiresistens]|uniref:SET domain-containing protein n=1 Tax=Cytobacillus purgationiresistens TaxID=863449 RepID=A0ABU0AH93_9BACI|nr:SET domain-containing protein [Cytobacillus purgationiresistens]MDQ0270623.1 SET domain-containing protein [Cytobacillus purgationiresistens]
MKKPFILLYIQCNKCKNIVTKNSRRELLAAVGPICIKDTQKYGRGVFSTRDIKVGELIEVSPVIISPKEEWKYLKKTILYHYGFYWGENYEDTAIALGYGSLFNHSYTPNAEFHYITDDLLIEFHAISDIKNGEEITINYKGDPKDRSPLWFDVIE